MKITATDDQSGAATVTLDGNAASIVAGGHGSAARLSLLDQKGQAVVSIFCGEGKPAAPPASGAVTTGQAQVATTHPGIVPGSIGQTPSVSVHGGFFLVSDKGMSTIRMDGVGSLTLVDESDNARIAFDNGGVMKLKTPNAQNSISLEGGTAQLVLGGGGVAGGITLRNSSGHDSIRIDAQTGDITLLNADCAECFEAADDLIIGDITPGMLLVLDESGKVRPSNEAYDGRVAGVLSGAGCYKPGLLLDGGRKSARSLPVALMGKVFCQVDATYGVIRAGDWLTTSPSRGFAMKATDAARSFGAVFGKALRPFAAGRGLVPVLVALR